MPFVLALDEGTTSCRAVIFDELGQVRGMAQREFTQHFPQPGWVEHDAVELGCGSQGYCHPHRRVGDSQLVFCALNVDNTVQRRVAVQVSVHQRTDSGPRRQIRVGVTI